MKKSKKHDKVVKKLIIYWCVIKKDWKSKTI